MFLSKKAKVSGFKLNPKKDGYRVLTLREIIAEKLMDSAKKSDVKKANKSKSASEELLDSFKDQNTEKHNHNAEPADIDIYTIAAILDGEVFEVLRAQTKLADMFLSQPKFVLVEEGDDSLTIGQKYVESGSEDGTK